MDFQTAQSRIKELRDIIDYHSRKYYDEDAPEIEDDEFDALTRELRAIETEYPQLINSGSYTQRIHGELSSLFTPVVHEVPLASLQDVFSFEELREFDSRVRETVKNPTYVVEPKIERPVHCPGISKRRILPGRYQGGWPDRGGRVRQSAHHPRHSEETEGAGSPPYCAGRGLYAAG